MKSIQNWKILNREHIDFDKCSIRSVSPKYEMLKILKNSIPVQEEHHTRNNTNTIHNITHTCK